MRLAVACWLLAGALALPLAAGAARADNGVASMTPAQILTKVEQDTTGAKSLHVYGAATSGGSRISLDLNLLEGVGGAGRFSEGALVFDIIRVGPAFYLKADQKTWLHFAKSSGLASLMAGKWMRVSTTSSDFADLANLTDITKLVDGILSSHGALVKGSTTTVNGHSAVEITDRSDGGRLYVATSGPAYPLLLKGKGSSGQLTFAWNPHVSVKAPAKSLDFRKLNG